MSGRKLTGQHLLLYCQLPTSISNAAKSTFKHLTFCVQAIYICAKIHTNATQMNCLNSPKKSGNQLFDKINCNLSSIFLALHYGNPYPRPVSIFLQLNKFACTTSLV